MSTLSTFTILNPIRIFDKNMYSIARNLFLVLSLLLSLPMTGQTYDLSKFYDNIDGKTQAGYRVPVIGVSAMHRADGGSFVPGTYLDAVKQTGAVPVVIPVTTDVDALRRIVSKIDGLILTGGDDVDPRYYKEDHQTPTLEIDSVRDIFDLTLIKLATDRNVPVLGICRGLQLINVAFGGTLYQDIPSQYESSSINHKPTTPRGEGVHAVAIEKGSTLSGILDGRTDLFTNSYHHQSVKMPAQGFVVTAKSPDGIVEAMEAYSHRKVLAVQWHPEAQVQAGDSVQASIFRFIMKEAETYRRAKELHGKVFTVDTHADTPLCFERIPGFDFGKRESTSQINIPKMEEGMLDAVFLVAYQAQGPRDAASLTKAVAKANTMIDNIEYQVEQNKDRCGIAFSADDLVRLKREGKKAVFVGIENGYGIGKDIANIARFKKRNVSYITLCHTKDNDICDSSSAPTNEWKGLSPYGYEVVKEMNRLGILVDVSHAGESTFWDVVKVSSQPVVATHSSARALCNHDRNLTDDQLRAIAKVRGVVQVCPVDMFVNKNRDEATLNDFIDHIDHVVKIAGIDCVGIGSDFDGGGGVAGLQGANDLLNITMKLIERGYSDADIEKIWGGNFLRVLREVQSGAKD